MEPINIDLSQPPQPPRRKSRGRSLSLRVRVVVAAFISGGLIGAAIVLVPGLLVAGVLVTGVLLGCILGSLAVLSWYVLLAKLTALRWGSLTHLTVDDSGLKLTWALGGLEYRPWPARATRFRVIFRKRPGPGFDRGMLAFPFRQEAEYRRIDGLKLLETARSKGYRITVRSSRRRHLGRVTVYTARARRLG